MPCRGFAPDREFACLAIEDAFDYTTMRREGATLPSWPAGRALHAAILMRRVVLVSVGFLLMLAGVVFTLQGVGVLGGSVMSGVTFWAVAGPVIALAGLVLAVIGLGGRLA